MDGVLDLERLRRVAEVERGKLAQQRADVLGDFKFLWTEASKVCRPMARLNLFQFGVQLEVCSEFPYALGESSERGLDFNHLL